MAEFKHPINEKVSALQSYITSLTGKFDIINIEVQSLLDVIDSTNKPCSWQFWMTKYLELTNELVEAGIVEEPKNNDIWKTFKEKGGII